MNIKQCKFTNDCANAGTHYCETICKGQPINGKYKTTKDMTNKKFGRLTVLTKSNKKDKHGHILWECKCECGKTTYATSSQLLKGLKLSCGCRKKFRKSNVKEILQEILGFIGTNQQFCIVDNEHKTLINVDELFDFISKLANEYGVKVE